MANGNGQDPEEQQRGNVDLFSLIGEALFRMASEGRLSSSEETRGGVPSGLLDALTRREATRRETGGSIPFSERAIRDSRRVRRHPEMERLTDSLQAANSPLRLTEGRRRAEAGAEQLLLSRIMEQLAQNEHLNMLQQGRQGATRDATRMFELSTPATQQQGGGQQDVLGSILLQQLLGGLP